MARAFSDTSVFSSPSFYPSLGSGSLRGGATNAPAVLYSYDATGGYDANGNVLSYTDSVMGSWAFGYDQGNRLVTAASSFQPAPSSPAYASWAPSLCWAYDAAGNRLEQASSNVPFTQSDGSCTTTGTLYQNVWAQYNAQNQMTGTSAPGWSDTPSYDAAGDVSNDGRNAYLYDAEGRICAVNNGNVQIGYLYDAAGNRVARGTISSWSCDITSNGFQQTEGFVVDGGGQQLSEVDSNNNWTHTNVWANGKQIATYDAQGLHYYFDDPLGTRRAQANAAGVLEATYQSLPFGDGFASTGNDDPTENHFTGKERDAESGNDYMFARYYNSATGRFLSPDWDAKNDDPVPYAKLDDPQSLNLYSYVRNSPVGRVDADGHLPGDFNGIDDNHPAPGQDVVIGAAKGAVNLVAQTWNFFASVYNAQGDAGDGQFIRAPIVPTLQYSNTTQAIAGGVTQLGLIAADAYSATPKSEEPGLVYKRSDPQTGEGYIGQSKSPMRYTARQGEHDSALGVKHEYEILDRGKPGVDLDVKEETQIRLGGGPKNKGGSLANKRYQMSEKNYRAAGGKVDKPTE